jgi:hypothetical protein
MSLSAEQRTRLNNINVIARVPVPAGAFSVRRAGREDFTTSIISGHAGITTPYVDDFSSI